jgi:hypothetical protein
MISEFYLIDTTNFLGEEQTMTSLTAAFIDTPVELRAGATEEDLQAVIRAVYKQVLGRVMQISQIAQKFFTQFLCRYFKPSREFFVGRT